MFYYLFVFNLLLIVCNSQDHLTCVRTDQVLSTSSSTPTRGQQGPPGKKGPIGLKGDMGQKGNRGEPGVADNSMIDVLRDEINQLQQQVETNKNYIDYRKDLDNGWIHVFTGYLHKTTLQKQSWDASRSICHQWGGDLVVYGVQNRTSISLLRRALSISSPYWIGLNDKATEGNYVWVNGGRESSTSDLWHTGEPNNHRGSEDCAAIISNDRANNYPCNYNFKAVCEKRLNL